MSEIWDDESLRPELARRIITNIKIIQGYSNDICGMLFTKTESRNKQTIRNYIKKE